VINDSCKSSPLTIEALDLNRALRRRSMLDAFTFLVMFVLAVAMIFLVVRLGGLPGKIAHHRNHPQADAINVCGWLGLATLGILWPIALIWSCMKPVTVPSIVEESSLTKSLSDQVADLQAKVALLENELDRLRPEKGEV
jgi:hypothetical protein